MRYCVHYTSCSIGGSRSSTRRKPSTRPQVRNTGSDNPSVIQSESTKLVGASDQYLRYHDFQHALAKVARCKFSSIETAAAPHSDLELASKLIPEISTLYAVPLDPLQRQMATGSVVGVLGTYTAKLTQSFNLYGKENALAAFDTSSTITLDGFVDFLNAYFEYEEFLSYQTIQKVRPLTDILLVVQVVECCLWLERRCLRT